MPTPNLDRILEIDAANIDAARKMLAKIIEAAEDGQNGSASYALDRLSVIRQLASMAARKLGVDSPLTQSTK